MTLEVRVKTQQEKSCIALSNSSQWFANVIRPEFFYKLIYGNCFSDLESWGWGGGWGGGGD